MITTLAINEDNDTYLDEFGNIAVLAGLPAVMQNCRTAMQAQLREMIYAYNAGMPTTATAFDGYNEPQFDAAGRIILQAVEGVIEVTEFQSQVTDGAVVYTASIKTIYGNGVVNG